MTAACPDHEKCPPGFSPWHPEGCPSCDPLTALLAGTRANYEAVEHGDLNDGVWNRTTAAVIADVPRLLACIEAALAVPERDNCMVETAYDAAFADGYNRARTEFHAAIDGAAR